MEKENTAVKIWDIIPINSKVNGIDELNSYPIFQFLFSGIVMENPGIRTDENEILFYNVSNASKDFKEKYKNLITELRVNKIYKYMENKNNLKEKNEIKDNISKKSGNLITLIPCDEFYFSLSNKEKMLIGQEFYKVINTDNGVKLDPIISIKGDLGLELFDSYISVNPETMSEELWSKIQNHSFELRENKPGLWNTVDNDFNKRK